MTTEQKANITREQAIEIVKTQYPHDHVMKTALGLLIPELHESEDEKIRKYLVEKLKAAKSVGELKFTIPQPTREECIAYLEKQKEQKPALKQTLDAYKISDERATAKMEGRIEGRQDVINNPEEYGLQKPAEWSEEDEDIRDTIIHDLKRLGGDIANVKPAYKKEIDWLKSLRPVSKESLQPHWKPSEEQMDALKELIDDAHRNGWVTPGATELYAQLKKLM